MGQSMMIAVNIYINGSWDAYLALSPASQILQGPAGDIITNLAKEREPEIEIIESNPLLNL